MAVALDETTQRLASPRPRGLLDSSPEAGFNQLAELACSLLHAPVSLVYQMAGDRLFFNSPEAAFEHAPCEWKTLSRFFGQLAMRGQGQPMICRDARLDAPFSSNPAINRLGVVACIAAPLMSADGVRVGTFCVIDFQAREWGNRERDIVQRLSDLTEREIETRRVLQLAVQRSEKLTRSNLELRRFVELAAHDLSGPLQAISMFGSMLERDLGGSTSAGKSLESLLRVSRRMKKTLTDLKHHALMGRERLSLSDVALGTLVEELLEELAVSEPGVRLDVEVADLPVIRASETLMRLLLQNLLENAVKFRSSDLVKLGISAVGTDSGWRLSVSDNGIGIPKTKQRVIFEPHIRLQNRRGPQGSGLGLSTCKGIASAHGGYVEVQSEPGKGATFHVFLPR